MHFHKFREGQQSVNEAPYRNQRGIFNSRYVLFAASGGELTLEIKNDPSMLAGETGKIA